VNEPIETEREADIIVLDRHRPDYRWSRRGIQNVLEDEAQDASFARWLADPKTGRFLVIDYLEQSLESMVVNADTERALIEIVASKIAAQLTARRYRPSIAIHVSPDIEAKLKQMCAEITAILNGKDPR
jgi:predicted transcriptional regulator